MFQNRTSMAILSVCLSSVVALAWAVTEAELVGQATTLISDYEALETDVDNCPNGSCSEAQNLIDELGGLGLELAQAHADRDTLQSCGCQVLDGLLDVLDAIDDELHVITDNWTSQG